MKARYTVVNGEVIAQKRNGVRSELVPDMLGSTVAIVDMAQTVTDRISYFPYGEVASRTGSTVTPFQFVGTLGYYQDTPDRSYVSEPGISTPTRDGGSRWRKRIVPICLCGISLASLLWLGVQYLEESSYENDYCMLLQYFLLNAYETKHGSFPSSLDDVEKDYESHVYDDYDMYSPKDRSHIEEAFRRYHPVIMGVINRNGNRVGIRVQFAGRYHSVYTVYQM